MIWKEEFSSRSKCLDSENFIFNSDNFLASVNVTVEEVAMLVSSLEKNKDKGCDEIHAEVFILLYCI